MRPPNLSFRNYFQILTKILSSLCTFLTKDNWLVFAYRHFILLFNIKTLIFDWFTRGNNRITFTELTVFCSFFVKFNLETLFQLCWIEPVGFPCPTTEHPRGIQSSFLLRKSQKWKIHGWDSWTPSLLIPMQTSKIDGIHTFEVNI